MRNRAAVAVAVGSLLALGGCGGGSAEPQAVTHTMPDGTVMSGGSMAGGHDDSHESGHRASGPSEAARMVCTGDVVDDVGRIMGRSRTPEPASSWQPPTFTCTFDLEQGPLVLTVHDATDQAAGMAYFQEQRTSAQGATPIKGVYSLGLPAFETSRGTASFVRDGKTLEVDATGLPARDDMGGQHDMSRSEIAYAVATSVLACWTEHT